MPLIPVDFSVSTTDNHDMKTTEKTTEMDALLVRLVTGKPLDAEIYRRIRENGERITEELRDKYGEMNIAVDLIHEVRDEA